MILGNYVANSTREHDVRTVAVEGELIANLTDPWSPIWSLRVKGRVASVFPDAGGLRRERRMEFWKNFFR